MMEILRRNQPYRSYIFKMLQKMKRTSLYAIILFVGSCNMSDVTEKIFDDYVLSTESKNSRAIIGGKNIILPDVVNYKFDSHFLIAKQKPDVDVIVIRKTNELLRLYKKKDSILSDSVYSLLKENGADGDSENNFKAARLTAKILLTKEKEDIMYKKYVENEYL